MLMAYIPCTYPCGIHLFNYKLNENARLSKYQRNLSNMRHVNIASAAAAVIFTLTFLILFGVKWMVIN